VIVLGLNTAARAADRFASATTATAISAARLRLNLMPDLARL
jgi:hypothetical protein